MSSYREALERFPADVQNEIEAFMGRWQEQSEKGANIVPNIEREQFLPPDCPDPTCPTSCMKSILRKIHENRHLSFDEVESVYQEMCYKHTRHGWQITLTNPPEHVGRAVSKDDLIAHLKRINPYYKKTGKAERLVRKLIDGKPLEESEKRLKMTEYTAWITWSKSRRFKNSFYFAKGRNRSYKICANLGLDPRQANDTLLLFTYPSRTGIPLHYPTIADAELQGFFQVAHRTAEHGWTKPWQRQWLTRDGIRHEPKPRPEAVHQPEELRYLQLPVELANP